MSCDTIKSKKQVHTPLTVMDLYFDCVDIEVCFKSLAKIYYYSLSKDWIMLRENWC